VVARLAIASHDKLLSVTFFCEKDKNIWILVRSYQKLLGNVRDRDLCIRYKP